MSELEKKLIEDDIRELFPDDTELKHNDLRTYNMFTVTKKSKLTVAFDTRDEIVEYMLVREN